MRKESDIIRTVAEQCLVTPRQIKEILSKVRDIVYSDVIDTGKTRIPIMGIGMMTKVKGSIPARMGKNPFTGEEVMFKAKPPSRTLKVKMTGKTKKLLLEKIDTLYGPPAEPEVSTEEESTEEASS